MHQDSFAGQVVIVTGASRGIGRGVASAFAATGATVVTCGRHRPDDVIGTFIEADLRQAADAQRLIDETVQRCGRLDVLINNAGGSPEAPAAKVSTSFIDKIVALNLLAPFYCAKAAYEPLRASGTGSIVNITSMSGLRASPQSAAYGAAKAGLINLTATLAVEWAPEIRVNALSPGLLSTENVEQYYGGADALAALAAGIPLRRFGTADDVAQACLFLSSPAASYISGANLVLNGGGEPPALFAARQGD